MKAFLCRACSAVVDLIEGALAVIALTVSYAFILEKDDPDHSTGLGLFIFLVWLVLLLVPDLIFIFGFKFRMRDTLLFQLLPLILGAGIYLICQFTLI